MGEDKAGLLLSGQPMINLARQKLQAVAAEVRIVGPKKKFGSEAIEDIFPDCGPLAGIHAALMASTAALNIVLAVDLPFIEPHLLRHLVGRAEQSAATVVVPQTADGYQPLCAVYRQSFGALAAEALKARRYKIDALFRREHVLVIDQTELLKAGIAVQQFQNVNTPADLRAARMQFAAK
jgi:molybdopterin-guanine dinucleotide biosynthesis protein A